MEFPFGREGDARVRYGRRRIGKAGVAAVAAIAVAGWALAAYERTIAVAAIAIAVLLLTEATGRRITDLLAFAIGGILVFVAAFGTTQGYFRLNRVRLETLVSQIAATPAIAELELGMDGTLPAADGGRRYDSYRFLNRGRITHYRDEAAPGASQPVLYVDDALRRLHVPRTRYDALRAGLERLSLTGYWRDDGGEIILLERSPGGTPWAWTFVFRPDDRAPQGLNVQSSHRLAPHWHHALIG